MNNEALQIDEMKREALTQESTANIFLEAGAGAGKSTLMVDRIIHQIAAGNQTINQIVAITFTEKAATELEEKIAKKLDEKLAELRCDATNVALCKEIEANRDSMFIGTIHSFCQKIIKERPLESGVPIRYDMVDEAVEENKREQFFYQSIQNADIETLQLFDFLKKFGVEIYDFFDLFQKKVSNKALGLTSYACVPNQTLEEIESEILSKEIVFDEEMIIPYRARTVKEGLKKGLVDDKNGEINIEEVIKFINTIEKMIDGRKTAVKLFKNFMLLQLQKIKEAYSQLKNGVMTEDFIMLFEEKLPTIEVEKKLNEVLSKDILEQDIYQLQISFSKFNGQSTYYSSHMKDNADLERLKENIKQWTHKILCPEALESLNAMVQNLLDNWAQQYLEENKLNGELTFDDLLFKAYTVLQDEVARNFFHQKFRHLYVDEVQDTDPLQMKILFLLTATRQPENWFEADTAPNSLFLVGDPKQSIYRFRNADLRIYDQVKALANKDSKWKYEELTINFRSNEYLINWFNKKFGPMFELEHNESIQPQYVKMEARTIAEDVADFETGVKFLKSGEDNYAEVEATNISVWIENNVNKLDVFDINETENKRKLTYSDVLIILPKTTKMNEYLHALHEAGIPTSFSGRIDINNFKEIHRLMALVHFIATPIKGTLLAAYAICKQQSLTKTYELQKNKTVDELLDSEQFAPFARLKTVAKAMPPHSFLEYVIYNEPSLVVGDICTELQMKTSLSILTTFIEKIRPLQFVSNKQMSQAFKQMLNDGTKLEYEMSIEQNADAVRLMNLHKSKGLEAAVVFLAGDSSFKEDDFVSHIDRNAEGETVYYSLYQKYDYRHSIVYTPSEMKPFEETMKQHENAEFIRLLYVAATRAKQLLIVGLNEAEDKNKEKFVNWTSLSNCETVGEWEELNLQPKKKDFVYKHITENGEQVSQMFKDTSQTYVDVSPSTLENLKLARVESDEVVFQTTQEDEKVEITLVQQFKGRLWGSIVHKMFEMHILEAKSFEDYDEDFYSIAIARGLTQYDLTTKEMSTFDLTEDLGQNRNARLQQILNNQAIRAELKKYLKNMIENKELADLINHMLAMSRPEIPFKCEIKDLLKSSSGCELSKIYKPSNIEGSVDIYISGVIDLVVVFDGELYIVDYKTNGIKEGQSVAEFHESLKKEYASQMLAYYEIAKILFNANVKGVYLYSTATNSLIDCKIEDLKASLVK